MNATFFSRLAHHLAFRPRTATALVIAALVLAILVCLGVLFGLWSLVQSALTIAT